jgi:hypothetical protein
MRNNLINAAAFQAIWFLCVYGGASGSWWLGPVAVLCFALWHIPRSANPRGELVLAACATAVALAVDSTYILIGFLSYPHSGPWTGVAPVWIIALWIGFALTLNHSLSWLHGRPVLAALLGGVGGPFSLWTGASVWGAVEFTAATPVVLAVLGVVWAVLTPLLAGLSRLIADGSISLTKPHPSMRVDENA